MSTPLAETVVGEIVAKHPGVARVFEKHQIDYCCQGNTTLVEACQRRDADLDTVVAEIETVHANEQPSQYANWNTATLTELADHIAETHHAFLRSELPRISGLVEKVFSAHGGRRPYLAEVRETFKSLREELESHTDKEDNVLFPAIRQLEAAGTPQTFAFGSLANPISTMEDEHDVAGGALERLRELNDDYTPPSDACPTFRVMLESLSTLERDLHTHIHKENSILFPRAKELEQAVSA